MKSAIVIVLVSLLGAVSADTAPMQPSNKYEVTGIQDAAAAEKFFGDLQAAVAKDDRSKVASMINYPLFVQISGRKVKLQKSADVLKQYDVVFNHRVKEAVAQQKVEELFVNWQGVMIGNGEIWFNQLSNSKKVRITAINN
jgi:hypothetical protein